MLKAVSTSASGGGGAAGITIGTSVITGGTNTRVLFDDNGVIGENAGLTFTKASGLLSSTVLAVGGATPGTNALAVTGTANISGAASVGILNVTSSATPVNGVNLAASNIIGFYTQSLPHWFIDSAGIFRVQTTGGPGMVDAAASSTAPTFFPNKQDTTTGIGAQAAGNISLIAAATERVRVATAAASVSDVLLPGTLFTGGTATTTFPQMLFQPTGTTGRTDYATTGTMIGANLVSGSTADFLNFGIGGAASVFKVSSLGAITSGSNIIASGSYQSGSAGQYQFGTRGILTSPASGSVQVGATDVASGALATTFTFQGNTATTTNGPLALIRGAGGGSSTSVGGELRLSGGLSSAAAGTGGAITFYTAPAANGATPALAATIDSTGKLLMASGKQFQLGNAATTGLTAGVLAATTNASIVITDSTGQAYRIPCII